MLNVININGRLLTNVTLNNNIAQFKIKNEQNKENNIFNVITYGKLAKEAKKGLSKGYMARIVGSLKQGADDKCFIIAFDFDFNQNSSFEDILRRSFGLRPKSNDLNTIDYIEKSIRKILKDKK